MSFSYRRRSDSSVENIVGTLIASHRAMRLDPVEYNLVLTLVLCRPGESSFLIRMQWRRNRICFYTCDGQIHDSISPIIYKLFIILIDPRSVDIFWSKYLILSPYTIDPFNLSSHIGHFNSEGFFFFLVNFNFENVRFFWTRRIEL